MTIHPYLRFNDRKCREAMTFYKDCLGGELSFQTVGESPMSKEMDKDSQDKIMHARLTVGDVTILGSDMMRDVAKVGDNIAITISFHANEEAKATQVFAKLSEGGEVFMPMEKVFWGAIFGVVTDKYGVEWMVNCGGEMDK